MHNDWSFAAVVLLGILLVGVLLGGAVHEFWKIWRRHDPQRYRLGFESAMFYPAAAARHYGPHSESDDIVDLPEDGRRLSFALGRSAVCELLSERELDELVLRAGPVLRRLKVAEQWLAQTNTKDSLGLVVVALNVLRHTFGRGRHWLEAIVLADLACFAHARNDKAEAERLFEHAAEVAAPWVERYPWLRVYATRRRLIRRRRWFTAD